MKNIVVFGGGNGLSNLLKAIKDIEEIKINAVVTVADSGGSTGEIRKYYNTPALGDLRRVLVSLAKQETILNQLMNYRFQSNHDNDPLNNHSLGNLIMLAVNNIKGFYDGIKCLSDIFKINGEVIPMTDNHQCELFATYTDNTTKISEHFIPDETKQIKSIKYLNEDEIDVNNRVIEVINEADLIVFSYGSLFTSIIASMNLPKIKQALIKNKHKKFVYVCNLVTQPGETHNMNVKDHINAIENVLEKDIIDFVIVNNANVSDALVKKYKNVNSELLFSNEANINQAKVINVDLIDADNKDVIRHDHKKIKQTFIDLLKLI